MTCNARYVLFLNPDTEVLEGQFSDLVQAMDERPTVGLIGVRQVTPDGRLDRTIRYFPNALRALGAALAADRLPRRPRWLGERELDPQAYDRETACDWTSGSFMLARREAIESAGYLDERYFMYSDETDLCRRIKTAGWGVRHLPSMTILHHDGKAGVKPNIVSLGAWTRQAYARKYFSPVHRAAYAGARGSGAFPAVGLRRAGRTGSPEEAGQPSGGSDHVGPGPRAVWTPEQGLPAHWCARAPRPRPLLPPSETRDTFVS